MTHVTQQTPAHDDEVAAALALADAQIAAGTRAANTAAVSRRWAIPDLAVDDLLADAAVARAQVKAISRRALCCPDLPALAFLAAVSCALAGKVRGGATNNDGSAYNLAPHLYVGAEAPSGANKSLVADAMLRDHLAGEGGVWAKMRREAEAAAAADLRERRKAARERDDLDRKDSEGNAARIDELEIRLKRPQVKEPQVAEIGAPSPEQFVRLCHQAGFRAIVPDEAADFLYKFMGGHGEQEKAAPLIAGFQGDAFVYPSIAGEQRGDHSARFPRLRLALLLLLQPSVLSPQVQAEALRLKSMADRGFFPRCLIARPRGLLIAERHAMEASALAHADEAREVGVQYGRILRALADLRIGDHPLAPSKPLVIPFAPEANRARRAYQVQCGDAVAEDGPDRGKPGERSIARLHDHAARIAVCLAAWRCAEQADAEGRALDLAEARVELVDVERAVRACEAYFRPHALAVAGRAVLDPVGHDADEVLSKLKTIPEIAAGEVLTKREISRRKFQAGWGKIDGRHRLDDALAELHRRGNIEIEGKSIRLSRHVLADLGVLRGVA